MLIFSGRFRCFELIPSQLECDNCRNCRRSSTILWAFRKQALHKQLISHDRAPPTMTLDASLDMTSPAHPARWKFQWITSGGRSALSSQCESIMPECVYEDDFNISLTTFFYRSAHAAAALSSSDIARSFKDINEHGKIIHGGKGVLSWLLSYSKARRHARNVPQGAFCKSPCTRKRQIAGSEHFIRRVGRRSEGCLIMLPKFAYFRSVAKVNLAICLNYATCCLRHARRT